MDSLVINQCDFSYLRWYSNMQISAIPDWLNGESESDNIQQPEEKNWNSQHDHPNMCYREVLLKGLHCITSQYR